MAKVKVRVLMVSASCVLMASGLFGQDGGGFGWRVVLETKASDGKPVTNVLDGTSAGFAVSVNLRERREGSRRIVTGRLENHVPNSRILEFEAPISPVVPVADGSSKLYCAKEFGLRVNRFPSDGRIPKCWLETERKGVYTVAAIDTYPGSRGSMAWTTVSDGQRGFYAGCHDPKLNAKLVYVTCDPKEKGLRFSFRYPLYLGAGETFDLPETVFADYDGDWHRAADIYRDWYLSVFKPAYVPKCLRELPVWAMVILKQQNDEIAWPYTDFDKLADILEAHGIDVVEFHGWGVGGHDKFYPEYDPDPAMGGREALKTGLRLLRKRGIHPILYANGQLIDVGTTAFWREKGRSLHVQRRDGTPCREHWQKFIDVPGHTFDLACDTTPAWRTQMLSLARQALDLGAVGIFYDQIGYESPHQCFNPAHPHPVGQNIETTDRTTLYGGIVAEMRKIDPEFAVMAEAFNDSLAPFCAAYQGHPSWGPIIYGAWETDAIENRFKGQDSDMFPEMVRYTLPWVVTTDRITSPVATRTRANQVAVLGIASDIEIRYKSDRRYVEEGIPPPPDAYAKMITKADASVMRERPMTERRDYLRKLSAFRRRFGDTVLSGRFVDTVGLKIDCGGGNVVAKRFVSQDGRKAAVFAWNAGDKPTVCRVSDVGRLVGTYEPESGEVAADSALAPDTVRLSLFDLTKGAAR